MSTLVSGVAASGQLHLGNYLGALRQWVTLQDGYRTFWFIADLHALTVPHDIKGLDLAAATRSMAALYLAVGLDPEEATIFRQSDVPAHTELYWLLGCLTPSGWLDRMTQYKAKAASREAERISLGLYSYPVLQAADILLYQADAVPVGADQLQHIEITREIARRFNHLFGGDTFTEPVGITPSAGARIMGLDNPEAKMSKTQAVNSDSHAIGLLEPLNKVRKKIMRAQTDSGSDINFETSGPGVRNLLTIFKALTGEDEATIEREFDGHGYGALKDAVATVVCDHLASIQKRYHEVLDDPSHIDTILTEGAHQAAARAGDTLARAREALGLDPRSLLH